MQQNLLISLPFSFFLFFPSLSLSRLSFFFFLPLNLFFPLLLPFHLPYHHSLIIPFSQSEPFFFPSIPSYSQGSNNKSCPLYFQYFMEPPFCSESFGSLCLLDITITGTSQQHQAKEQLVFVLALTVGMKSEFIFYTVLCIHKYSFVDRRSQEFSKSQNQKILHLFGLYNEPSALLRL